MKKKTKTAPHPVTEIRTIGTGATKGAVTTVVLVETIIVNVTENEALTTTAKGRGHGVMGAIVRLDATTVKTGNRRVEGAKIVNVLGRLIVGRLRLQMQPLSPKGSAKRPVGMLQLRGTSNIRPCKRSKRVGGGSMVYTHRTDTLSGLFNLPGANRSHGPQIIGFGAHPPIPTGLVPNTNLARQSRRLYLGSITNLADEDSIALFFNAKMREMGLSQGPGNPVLAVQVNREKNYAFVEFRSAEDATAGMQLDGTVFLDGPLRVRRPHDYAGPETLTSYNTMLPSTVPDSENKIFVGGLPPYLNEDQVVELLKSFGELKSFNLVREHGNGPSKVRTFSMVVPFSNYHP
jgi:RNA recognition motif. (a.k.a. RRM, RBD, or RNP domain)